MTSIFGNKRPQPHLQRNAFDLSHSDIFSIAPGMLLPIHVQEVNPNEHFEFNPNVYVRTMPLNTAAFVRAKQHVEFFFVPMRTLCRQWNQFIVGTDYKISSISALNNYKDLGVSLDLSGVSKSLALNLDSTAAWNKNIFGLSWCRDAVRLFDMLGYGINSTNVVGLTELTGVKRVNIFRFLAYQKVYYDNYRNPLYELNEPSSYNVDSLFGTNTVLGASNIDDVNSIVHRILTLRYRNWSKDYFTCANPQWLGADYLTQPTNVPLNMLAVGENILGNAQISNKNEGSYAKDNLSDASVQSTGIGAYLTTPYISQDNASFALSVANLRAAFAYDKMLRLSVAAGDGDYGSQIRAHYGFNAVHDDWKSTFIGGCSAPVNISEVLTTATTEQAPTGDIYGKGASFNQGTFSFDTKEHGIIIGILSIVPEADYQSSCLDKFNTKFSREEYFQPEFADLGKQPIVATELDLIGSTADGKFNTDSILGYVSRYMEYKTCIDKVHGQFVSNGTLSAWSAPRNNPAIRSGANYGFSSTSLKVDPRIFNPIVSVVYNGTDKTDQFIIDCTTSCRAIRPMSITGEPML